MKKLIKKFQNPASPIQKKPNIVLRDRKTNKDYTMRDDGYFYVDQVGEDGNPIELKVDKDGNYNLDNLDNGVIENLSYYTYDVDGYEDLRYEFVDLEKERAEKERAEKAKAAREAKKAELMRVDKENEEKAKQHELVKVDHLVNVVTPAEFLRSRGHILKNNMQDWMNDLTGATNDADKVEITDEQVQQTIDAAIKRMDATPATVVGKFGRYWYPHTTTDNQDLGFKTSKFGQQYDGSKNGINGLFTANGGESTLLSFPEMQDYLPTKERNTQYIKDYINFVNDPKRSDKRYIMYYLDNYLSPNFKITSAHEGAHALQLDAAEYAIEKYFNSKTKEENGNKKYEYLKDGVVWDDYLDKPNEVYARVKSVQAQGMQGGEYYNADQIKEWIKKTGVYGLADRYTDDDLEFLFNKVAYQAPTFNYQFPGFNSQTPTMAPVGYRPRLGMLNSSTAFVKKGSKLVPKQKVGKFQNPSGPLRSKLDKANEYAAPVAKAASSFIPLVGTYQDYKAFKENPTWGNAGWLALSALGDALTLSGIGAGAGTAIKAGRAARAANAAYDTVNAIRRTGDALDTMADAGKAVDAAQKAKTSYDLINSYSNI